MSIARILPFILSIILISSAGISKAQYSCTGGRFLDEVFSNPTLTSNVTFGSSITVSGGTQSLEMDIYQPEGDTMQARPLIVLAHGGSFMFGDKTSLDIVTLCRKYAKLGYVTASINYRLGFEGFLPNANTATETVYRATADMRAAIRYFRKDASTTNAYKIDTNNIFAGGVSAGAFIALHLAYLDEVSEIPSAVNPDDFGGIEGNSGNPGYSSKVKAIVNLCGAIGDTSWIQPSDAPCLSMHGTNDNVVPYGSAVINVLGIPLFEVDGSASVAKRQENIGLNHQFVTWYNAPHTPFISSSAYMDSVMMFMTPFLADQLGCDVPTAVKQVASSPNITIYPNPASDIVVIQGAESLESIELFSISGKSMLFGNSNVLNISELPSGIYILRILLSNAEMVTKRLVINK